MANSRGIRAGAAYVELFLSDSKLVRGLEKAGKKLKAFGKAVAGWGEKIALAGAAVTGALLGAAQVFGDLGSHLDDVAQRTGLSAEALSEMAFVANQSGSDLDTFEQAVRGMARAITYAGQNLQTYTRALAQIGLSYQAIKDLSPEQQFMTIAQALAKVQDPTERAGLAMQIFGSAGTQLLPMIALGTAGIEALRQQARALGLTMSSQDVRAAADFSDALERLWKVVQMGLFRVGAALAPTLLRVVLYITEVLANLNAWIDRNRDVVVSVLKIAAGVTVAGAVLAALGYAIIAVGATLSALRTILGHRRRGSGDSRQRPRRALVAHRAIAAIVALGGYLVYASGVGAQALAWLGERFEELKSFALEAFGGIADAMVAGDIALAVRILWLTLQIAWTRGIEVLELAWLDFKSFFLKIAYNAFYGALAAGEIAWHGLEVAFIETVAFLGNVWTLFTSGFQKAWNTAITFTTKRLLELQHLFDNSFDLDQAKQMADQDLASTNAQIEQQKNATILARDQQRQQDREDAARQHDATMAVIGAEASAKEDALRAEYDRRVKDSEAELARFKKEWQDAIAEANKKRQEHDSKQPESPQPPKDLIDALDNLAPVIQQKLSVTGTFNPIAAAGLGTGSYADRIGKATEDTAKNTKRLVQQAQTGA